MKIAIAVPCLDTMSTDCAMSIMALAFRRVYDPRFNRIVPDIALIHHKGSIIPHARTNLVEQSLTMNASHIFFVDSDIVLPPDALDRLVSHHKDIVLASYIRRYSDTRIIGLTLTDGPKHATLVPMATAPLGCALINLRVFARIPRPWFTYNFAGEIVEGTDSATYSADMSEDVNFFAKAREAGFNVWLDPHLTRTVGHAGSLIHRYDPQKAKASAAL